MCGQKENSFLTFQSYFCAPLYKGFYQSYVFDFFSETIGYFYVSVHHKTEQSKRSKEIF